MLQRHAILDGWQTARETDSSTQDPGHQRKSAAQGAGQFDYPPLASWTWLRGR
jgi:hypothetical protein